MARFESCIAQCLLVLFSLITTISLSAQTFNTLTDVPSTDPADAQGLIQATDGNFYGVTTEGGPITSACSGGCGTVFKVTPEGAVTTLYTFCSKTNCTDGANPVGTLVQGADGNFYGVTENYEAIGIDGCVATLPCGTLFKITPVGTLTTLHTFKGTDGLYPNGGLVQDLTTGEFFGTTQSGGIKNGICSYSFGCGTVFSMSPSGTFKTLYSFCSQSNCTDGGTPAAGLDQASDRVLFGTTKVGGNTSGACATAGCGTVFAIRFSGVLSTLHSFDGADGMGPHAPLVQANSGCFYGSTTGGGANDSGTLFHIAANGYFVTLASLSNSGDPSNIFAPLAEGTDGNFYGAVGNAGTDLLGLLFNSTPGGLLTPLHNFAGESDGMGPTGLLQATSGMFYGTTAGGRPCSSCSPVPSAVFTLDMGLGPFVALRHDAAAVGQTIGILGQGLAGTTAVSFNGAAATFTKLSGTYLTATVPSGATTGFITVTTPGGNLTSNQKFWVIP